MPEGLVDWTLAERVARALSGTGPRWDGTEEELRSESARAAAAGPPLHRPEAEGRSAAG